MITGEEKETGTTWVNWRKMLVTLLPNFLEINIKKKDVLLSWVENTESEFIYSFDLFCCCQKTVF